MGPNLVTFDSKKDEEMAAELANLDKEREQIVNQTHPGFVADYEQLQSVRKRRLRVALDARTLRLADATARSVMDGRVALAEFHAAKAALRAQLMQSSATVRRLGITKRRPRSAAYMHALERSGVLRLALSPDDVTGDLAAMRRGPVSETPASGAGDWAAPVHVHTVHGRLHFHDAVFEKGYTVAVYPNKPGSLPKWHGEVVAITRKEISIRANDGKRDAPGTVKVGVAGLKSGKWIIKRDKDGSSLRNKKL